jgi:hypothetical protein
MSKLRTVEIEAGSLYWLPERCEECGHGFDERQWESDYALSGELTWICPSCQHVNYPPIGERDAT